MRKPVTVEKYGLITQDITAAHAKERLETNHNRLIKAALTDGFKPHVVSFGIYTGIVHAIISESGSIDYMYTYLDGERKLYGKHSTCICMGFETKQDAINNMEFHIAQNSYDGTYASYVTCLGFVSDQQKHAELKSYFDTYYPPK